MATILLSAAGAAIGSSVGGSVLGLSMTAVGRFVGASIGRGIDQRLMGHGSDAVETGRLERIHITAAGEGTPIPQVHGRMRVGGHIIWASEFREHVREDGGGGGKGAPAQPTVRRYSYSVSLAIALCDGEIATVGRVWADGEEVALADLNMRLYRGTADQLPDAKIEAVEGAGQVPAYRGTAYVVFEDLLLERFGNRIPQFSFEIVRPSLGDPADMPQALRGVAMIPGTGEYALATEPVHLRYSDPAQGLSLGDRRAVANVNSASDEPDFNTALRQLQEEAPSVEAVSLIVSWFGDDLRCGACQIRPKVEQTQHDAADMPWRVCGVLRAEAETVPAQDGRPIYGGTPCDTSVLQAIRRMTAQGLAVMYYPFILMDQVAGNGRIDPWTGAPDQPPLPWRGRITTSLAPDRPGSPDGTSVADTEVAEFFGTARASDFVVAKDEIQYSGPDEWRYNRFILHQAALCAAAGGVEAFCIGSEMRGLSQIRGAGGFPAVEALRTLAADCRAILGPDVKIGYAADWSEYFGYHPQDGSGDLYFHLDPLWADDAIDFIGIDNYMPLSDWREGDDHADAAWGSIYDLAYLEANVAGGEGYHWYYASDADREAQIRTPITDGAHGEPWVWRYKDLRNWWENPHHDRIGGVRQPSPTAWQPRSKPFWFTEFGCAAIDKGTNQPNKFLDPKSSESRLPYFSTGVRDDTIQRQYLRATTRFWTDPDNNPWSDLYQGRMLNMDRAFVWAWDARPYPWFPGNEALWSDGPNYRRGHWIDGRVSSRSLASVVGEICARAGVTEIDTARLHGTVRGYCVSDIGDARRALQPLMIAHGFDAVEREGRLEFRSRTAHGSITLDPQDFADCADLDAPLVETRDSEAETRGRVRIRFSLADADHTVAAEEASRPDAADWSVAETDLGLSLTRAEALQTAERWLSEAEIARDTLRFALPPSRLDLGAGDVIRVTTSSGPLIARIDRVEVTDRQIVDAVRITPELYRPAFIDEVSEPAKPTRPAVPVSPIFMDLPLLRGDEIPHAPHLALHGTPWPGPVAVYHAAQDHGFALDRVIGAGAVVGVTEVPLRAAPAGRVDRGPALQLRLFSGALETLGDAELLAGGNLMAIGDGSADRWEILQFRHAELVGENRWQIWHRLRGQAGSDGMMPPVWPAGSIVVLLDGRPTQIGLPATLRGVERHYRIGPARRGYDDPSYVHVVSAFSGNGLRPYKPVHLRTSTTSGTVTVSWIRRTRIDGDAWDGADVPLGEDRQRFLVRIEQAGTLRREAVCTDPTWHYTAAERAEDGVGGAFDILVAQLSDRFGPGPFARATVTA